MSQPQPAAPRALSLLIFLGSARQSSPPAPARLGSRVTMACQRLLVAQGTSAEVIDPLDVPLDPVFKPHFAYATGRAPDALETLAQKIQAADGYVMVSPEYNHAMSPALANLLNHFGSSLFAFKPSAIVTYSAGQWGGARAAVNMRTFLSELGCLPVSAMVHVPHAQDVLDEQGQYIDQNKAADWDGYFARTLSQLLWWCDAARAQREQPTSTTTQRPPAFKTSPAERDAPGAT